jgi:peptidoglycan/xylan/chitin deacetylase (PgdA/CDA1 family)
VGSHTFDHLQLPLLDDEKALDQVVRTESVFIRVFGERPWLIRPPGGARSPRIDTMLSRRGYTSVMWNLGTGDAQVDTAGEVYRTWKRVFERRQRNERTRGGIIMLHDTHSWSVDAFQLIVSDLMERNCRLLEQGQELYDFVDDPAPFFAPRNGGPVDGKAPQITLNPQALEQRQSLIRIRTAERCRHPMSF